MLIIIQNVSIFFEENRLFSYILPLIKKFVHKLLIYEPYKEN